MINIIKLSIQYILINQHNLICKYRGRLQKLDNRNITSIAVVD